MALNINDILASVLDAAIENELADDSVEIHTDEDGHDYILIEAPLRYVGERTVLTEIDDNTFGTLRGFRVYLNP